MKSRKIRIGLGFRSQGLALAIVPLLLGCGGKSTLKLYDGDPRPADQIATIESWKLSGMSSMSASLQETSVTATFIRQVDDHVVSEKKPVHASVQVTPGSHRLKVGASFLRSYGSNQSTFLDPEPIEFVAAAGQRYVVRARTDTSGKDAVLIRFWIEDSSGTVVAGTK